MKLHNTLSRKLEKVTPIVPNEISLYSCGPTVYNYYHIGNLRNAVFNDTLRRTLEVAGFKVKHVMNITDVGHLASDADEGEDKLEKGASREGKTVQEVAEFYTDAFKKDMISMNVLPPNAYHSKKYDDNYARATEFIDEQIAMVALLMQKGLAYQTAQAIYFDVTKLPDYGELSGQKLADKETGARDDVITDDDKHSPHDFALWFFTVGRFANHTMHWPTPWGNGFPGWHLECSAIIHATLGDPIDIHTGGVDHIGTHHPNEIAQTKAAYGNELSKMWLHNEFILVDGKKMSKSKENSYTLADIEKKGFNALDYRMLVLQAHYRSELNFSWGNLEAARARLQSYNRMADLQWQAIDTATWLAADTSLESIKSEMENDLNTPLALAFLSGFSALCEEKLISSKDLAEFSNRLGQLDSIFGLDLTTRKDITAEQKSTMINRGKAREAKDWAKSDELRAKLREQGLEVRDTEHGQIWSRT